MSAFLDRLTAWLAGPAAPAPPPADKVDASPKIGADDPRLPNAVRPNVTRLLGLVADVERRSEGDPVLISALTEVRQLRDTHLPQLIASYAEIPASHRAEIFRQTGKSASYNLNAAIERMIGRLEALSKSMAQDDIDSFADNLRFIENRYGRDDPLI